MAWEDVHTRLDHERELDSGEDLRRCPDAEPPKAETDQTGAVDLVVRSFERTDQEPVRQLVLPGLEERWGFLDPSLNEDLEDISASYANDVFLVGVHEGNVIASGALRIRGNEAEIVRMSVALEWRRRGVGGVILQSLMAAARRLSLRRVVLETTARWTDARAFYESHGFEFVAVRSSEFGVDAHYEMRTG